MTQVSPESTLSVCGVTGRMYARHKWDESRFSAQKWISEGRKIAGYGVPAKMWVEIRFDDSCKNGHNSFAVTANVWQVTNSGAKTGRDILAGGCMHDEIAKVFPELAHLIKWHLVSTDSPMHYVANTVYHASDRDHNGRKAGEPCSWQHVIYFGNSPVSHKLKKPLFDFLQSRMEANQDGGHYLNKALGEFQIVSIAHPENAKPGAYQFGPKFTFAGYGEKWHECPFDDEATAQEWVKALNNIRCEFGSIVTDYAKGKERNLDAARSCGVWPDATDADLMQEPEALKAALMARLPALVDSFRSEVTEAGFAWSPSDIQGAQS